MVTARKLEDEHAAILEMVEDKTFEMRKKGKKGEKLKNVKNILHEKLFDE